MAAIARGTPNFTAPPSQNTAPVDEFRCLFTHDIRKKQKKWHDGVVKFHTFNRRVMVYDDARNYVGDLHYRGDEHFGEGVELQLDRGVMIEVGEPLGRTQTDVTELVNRGHGRGDTNVSPRTNSTSQPVRRINTTDTHGRPKSLAEVLGASQGRLGRARLPAQSPFEQRQVMEEARPTQPPPKKQKTMYVQDKHSIAQPSPGERIASGKENVSARRRASPKPQHVPQESVIQRSVPLPTRDTANTSLRQRTLPTSVQVVDLSSDEEILQTARTGQGSGPEKDSSRAREQQIRVTSKNKEKPPKAPEQKPVGPPEDKQKERTKTANSHGVERPIELASIQSPVPYSNPVGSPKPNSKQASATLRFAASTKTRPKLMYKALLPSIATRTASTSTSRDSSNVQERDLPTVSVLEARETVDHEHNSLGGSDLEFDLEKIDSDRDDRPPPRENNPIQQHDLDTRSNYPSPIQASALFVSQPDSEQQHSPSPLPVPKDDSLGMSLAQELGNFDANIVLDDQQEEAPVFDISTQESISSTSPSSPTVLAVPVATEESAVQGPTRAPAVTPQSPSSQVRRPVEATTVTTPRPPSPIRPPNMVPPMTTRSFRRVLSENDSMNFLNNPLPSTTISPANPLPRIETPLRPGTIYPPAEISPTLTRRRSPTKQSPFKRSFSDPQTQAIIPQPLEIETVDTTLKSTDEQGPWTKLEAFLLFNTWPESKKASKPVFERVAGVNDDDGLERYVLPKVNMMGRFRSARMVLRDEE